MNGSVIHPHLSLEERDAWNAWAKVYYGRLDLWPVTETGQMFASLELSDHTFEHTERLRHAFAEGDLDGSVAGLRDVIAGIVHLQHFGEVRRLLLAAAVIEWYEGRLSGG